MLCNFFSGPLESFLVAVEAKDVVEAKRVLVEHKSEFTPNIDDVLAILSQLYKREDDLSEVDVTSFSDLVHFAASNIGLDKPKLVVMALESNFGSDASSFNGVSAFIASLKPLFKALKALNSASQTRSALDYVLRFAGKLSIPSNAFEGEEKMLLEADSELNLALDVVESVLEYVGGHSEAVIRLLANPLSRCELKPISRKDASKAPFEPRTLLVAKSAVKTLLKSNPDLIRLVQDSEVELIRRVENDDEDVDVSATRIGFGVLFYVVFNEAMNAESIPSCYAPLHVLDVLTPYA